MKSKFSIGAVLVILCFLGFVTLLITSLFLPNDIPIPISIFLIFVSIWLFFGEIRTKLPSVRAEDSHLIVQNFVGFGKTFRINYSDVDGFKTSLLPSRIGYFEYFYLMKGEKKVIKISQFYHRNYFKLKEHLQAKLQDLGIERFSFLDEIKETFS